MINSDDHVTFIEALAQCQANGGGEIHRPSSEESLYATVNRHGFVNILTDVPINVNHEMFEVRPFPRRIINWEQALSRLLDGEILETEDGNKFHLVPTTITEESEVTHGFSVAKKFRFVG